MRDWGAEWAELDKADEEAFARNRREWFHTAWLFDRGSRRREVLRLLSTLGGSEMARGAKKPTTAKAGSGSQWTTFVEIPVPAEAWDDINSTFGTEQALFDAVTEAVATGHRLSVSYNGQNDVFNVSLTGKGPDCVNDGCTLVSFGPTWVIALQVALYKHAVIAEGDWSGSDVVAKRPSFG